MACMLQDLQCKKCLQVCMVFVIVVIPGPIFGEINFLIFLLMIMMMMIIQVLKWGSKNF